MYRILAINFGSTSTKIAFYEDEICVTKVTLQHSSLTIATFSSIWEQYDIRLAAIEAFLTENHIPKEELSAVVSRGGHTHPLAGGTYLIEEVMLAESASERYGNHPCDLGLRIAASFQKFGALPLTADTPSTDEFEPLARYSGLPEMVRRSSFHALNHKAVAKQYAKDIGRSYNEINLVVAHMGGGISVAAHKRGRMVDANNALDGDGPFSSNRTGTLPVGKLVEACYSGKYTIKQMQAKINGMGGMVAYLGESDLQTVQKQISEGNKKAEEVVSAMAYQVGKEIGSCAAVLHGNVDAVLLTGGMAYDRIFTSKIEDMVRFIAPLCIYAGEYEMQSLAMNALEVLRGEQQLLQLSNEV